MFWLLKKPFWMGESQFLEKAKGQTGNMLLPCKLSSPKPYFLSGQRSSRGNTLPLSSSQVQEADSQRTNPTARCILASPKLFTLLCFASPAGTVIMQWLKHSTHSCLLSTLVSFSCGFSCGNTWSPHKRTQNGGPYILCPKHSTLLL